MLNTKGGVYKRLKDSKLYNDFGCTIIESVLRPKTYDMFYVNSLNKQILSDEPCFCIIYIDHFGAGTFEVWFQVVYQVMNALAHDMIPYIDMRTFKNPGWYGDFADKETNRWDLSFKQPQYKYSFEYVHSSRNRIMIDASVTNYRWSPFEGANYGYLRNKYHEYWGILGANERIMNKLPQNRIPPKTVFIPIRRGMEWGNPLGYPDYTAIWSHHRIGTVEAYIKTIAESFEKEGMDYAYVSCDDRETLDLIVKEFGNRILFFDRRRLRFFHNNKPIERGNPEKYLEYKSEIENNNLLQALDDEYILETIMASQCDAIVNINTGQAIMADIIRESPFKYLDNSIILNML